MAIGDNIRSYRKQLGMTQTKLGEISGIHPVTIRKYESNKSVPQHAQVLKLAEALEIPYGFLYGDIDLEHEAKSDDVLDAIMQLFKTGLLVVSGERSNEDCLLFQDTIMIKASPTAVELFDLRTVTGVTLNPDDGVLCMKNKAYLAEILKWEKLDYIERQHELFKTLKSEELKKVWPFLTNEMISVLQKCSIQAFGKLFFPQAFAGEE